MRSSRSVIIMLTIVMFITFSAVGHSKVKIVYGHRTESTEAQWAAAIADRFEQLHPDIEVETVPVGHGDNFDEKLAVLVAAGSTPDIFYGSADKLGFIFKGWTHDLTALIERDRRDLAMDTFFPDVWSTVQKDGKFYGVPLAVVPQTIFWNKEMFAASGLQPLTSDWNSKEWTWDQFVSTLKKLTVQNADGTYEQLGVSSIGWAPDLCWMFGGDFFPAEAYRTHIAQKATFTQPENVAALEAVQDIYASYAAAGPSKGISSWSGFMEGKVAMDWTGMWKINHITEAYNSGSMGFEWGMAPLPLVENRANTRFQDPLYIAADTKHLEAAWEFVKFATGTTGQRLWAQITGKIPARRTAINDFVAYMQDQSGMGQEEILQTVGGAIEHSRSAIEDSIFGVWSVFKEYEDQWFTPALNGKKSVTVALQQAQDAYTAMLPEINEGIR